MPRKTKTTSSKSNTPPRTLALSKHLRCPVAAVSEGEAGLLVHKQHEYAVLTRVESWELSRALSVAYTKLGDDWEWLSEVAECAAKATRSPCVKSLLLAAVAADCVSFLCDDTPGAEVMVNGATYRVLPLAAA